MEKYIQYVNSTMDEINDLSSDLYEALVDKQDDDVRTVIKKLTKVLLDVKKSLNEEIH